MTITDPKTIARIPLAHVDDIAEQLRADVLERARQQFGYKADTLAAQGPLGAALRQLEIAPLNKAEVRLYMQSKEKEWHGWQHWACTWGTFAVPALCLVAYLITCRANHWTFWLSDGSDSDSHWGCLVLFILGTLALWCGTCIPLSKLPDVSYQRTWRKWVLGRAKEPSGWIMGPDRIKHYSDDGVASYPRFVPVHALNLALEVKAIVPDALFHVHELTLKVEEVAKPLPDPFLSVVLGSEEYFLAVWDERDFEVRK